MEITDRSWKEQSEVGKFFLSWKVSLKLESFAAVGKFWPKLESLNELGKLSLKLESVIAFNKFIIKRSLVQKGESGRSRESGRSVQKWTVLSQTGR